MLPAASRPARALLPPSGAAACLVPSLLEPVKMDWLLLTSPRDSVREPSYACQEPS